jgi:predicted nucleic acid-binding protein
MKKLKIYLDVCSYNRPFDDQSQMKIRLETEAKLHIQSSIKEGKYWLVWSYIIDFENYNNSYEDRKASVEKWRYIADEYCPSSDNILSLGKSIMGLGVKELDSLHLACAIESKCDYFITTDRKLLNKPITSVKMRNPIDFVLEMEGADNED